MSEEVSECVEVGRGKPAKCHLQHVNALTHGTAPCRMEINHKRIVTDSTCLHMAHPPNAGVRSAHASAHH